MLAERFGLDGRRVVWLSAQPEILNRDSSQRSVASASTLSAESLPESAFGPLSGFVDYILDRATTELTAWSASFRFDWTPFVVQDLQVSTDMKVQPLRPNATNPTVRTTTKRAVPTPSQPPADARSVLPSASTVTTPVDAPDLSRLLRLRARLLALEPSPTEAPASERGFRA